MAVNTFISDVTADLTKEQGHWSIKPCSCCLIQYIKIKQDIYNLESIIISQNFSIPAKINNDPVTIAIYYRYLDALRLRNSVSNNFIQNGILKHNIKSKEGSVVCVFSEAIIKWCMYTSVHSSASFKG